MRKGISGVVVFILLILISILSSLLFYGYYYNIFENSLKDSEFQYLELPPKIVDISTNDEFLSIVLSYEKNIQGKIAYMIKDDENIIKTGSLIVNLEQGINNLSIPVLLSPHKEYYLTLLGNNWRLTQSFYANSEIPIFMDFNGNLANLGNLGINTFAYSYKPLVLNDFENEPFNLTCVYYNYSSTFTCSISQSLDSFYNNYAVVLSNLNGNAEKNQINITYSFNNMDFNKIEAISFFIKAELSGGAKLNNTKLSVYAGDGTQFRLLNRSIFSLDSNNYKIFRIYRENSIVSDFLTFGNPSINLSNFSQLRIVLDYDKNLNYADNTAVYIYLDTISISEKTDLDFSKSSINLKPFGDFIYVNVPKNIFKDNYSIFILGNFNDKLNNIKIKADTGYISILLKDNTTKESNISICSINNCLNDSTILTTDRKGMNIVYLVTNTNKNTSVETYLFGVNYKNSSTSLLNMSYENIRIYFSYNYPFVGKLDKFIIFNKKIKKEFIDYLSTLNQ